MSSQKKGRAGMKEGPLVHVQMLDRQRVQQAAAAAICIYIF
jgi:hypothetical protein